MKDKLAFVQLANQLRKFAKKELRYLSKRLHAVRLADLHVPVTWFLQPSSEGSREVVCSLPSGRFCVAPEFPTTFAPCEAGLYAPSMASSQCTSSSTCTCSLNHNLSWLRTAYAYCSQNVKAFHIRYDRNLGGRTTCLY